MIVLSCPNCNASLEFGEERDFAFCQYCGTKITNISNKIELDRTVEIKNLTIRALEFERRGDYKKCEEYCNRILDLDPTNREIRELEKRLPTYSAGPNVTIIYKSVHDYKYKLRVSLDGRNWEILNHGETLSLTLPVGGYQIIFSGTKRYLYNLSVFDEDEKITVIYDAQRWKNEIEEIRK